MYSINDFVLFEQNKAATAQETEAILCSLVTCSYSGRVIPPVYVIIILLQVLFCYYSSSEGVNYNPF